MTTDEMITYDQIVEMGIATADEINLVRCVSNGTWTEILNNIIFARTGYRSIQQMINAEDEEEEEEEVIHEGWAAEEWNTTKNVMDSILVGFYA